MALPRGLSGARGSLEDALPWVLAAPPRNGKSEPYARIGCANRRERTHEASGMCRRDKGSTTMTAITGDKSSCSHCHFWHLLRPHYGLCERNAPKPSGEEQIAHWPETNRDQGCGEFETPAVARVLTHCGDCQYWRRPPNGFEPDDKGDKVASWWAMAGHCTRHAPQPSSDPGPRAFWPATHATDQCAEGKQKVPNIVA